MSLELTATFHPTGDQPHAIEELTGWVRAGHPHATLLGVTGSGKTFTMAGVIAATRKPTLVVCPNKTLAAQLYGEFREFFPTAAVHYFVSYYDYYQPEAYVPQSDTYIEKEAQINEEIDRLRHAATQSLLTRKDVIIVASVSCIYGLGSPEEYGSVKMLIRVGDRIERRALLRQLVDLQFQRNDMDLTRGTFRVKGDTVEIFPKASDKDWIRIVWDGDAIERITARDISGATGSLEEVTIFPATHYVAAPAKFRAALDGIRSELEQQLRALRSQDKLLEAQRLSQRTTYDLQMLEEAGYVHGIENYSRHFDGRDPGNPPFTLVDFYNYAYGIPPLRVRGGQGELRTDRNPSQPPLTLRGGGGWLCFIDESHITIPQLRGMYAGDRSRKETLVSYGFRLPSCLDNRPLRFDEFRQRTSQTIYVSATPEEYEMTMSVRSSSFRGATATRDLTPSTSATGEISRSARNDTVLVAEQLIRPTGLLDPEVEVRPSDGQIPDLIREVQERVRKHQRVLVTVLTKRMAEDLAEYLNERTDSPLLEQEGVGGSYDRTVTPPNLPLPKGEGIPIRAYYLHADVETFERIEILDDLRRGRYDVVVGINLLREGLDLPEVSLVAILDADKEGYLRSRTALVQTMGRAARHAEGRVIMYADRMTESIRLAVAEVERRRKTQEAYNREHGITPTSIVKEIRGPIVGASTTDRSAGSRGQRPRRRRKK